jgi:hypothetical protein
MNKEIKVHISIGQYPSWQQAYAMVRRQERNDRYAYYTFQPFAY